MQVDADGLVAFAKECSDIGASSRFVALVRVLRQLCVIVADSKDLGNKLGQAQEKAKLGEEVNQEIEAFELALLNRGLRTKKVGPSRTVQLDLGRWESILLDPLIPAKVLNRGGQDLWDELDVLFDTSGGVQVIDPYFLSEGSPRTKAGRIRFLHECAEGMVGYVHIVCALADDGSVPSNADTAESIAREARREAGAEHIETRLYLVRNRHFHDRFISFHPRQGGTQEAMVLGIGPGVAGFSADWASPVHIGMTPREHFKDLWNQLAADPVEVRFLDRAIENPPRSPQ